MKRTNRFAQKMMLTIPGYHMTEQLYESTQSIVYRARRDTDNLPVVLKILRDEYPPPDEIARFKREYEMTRSLDIEGVIDVYNLETHKNTLMMVLEDFGGESLKRLLSEYTLALCDFLRFAIRITDILGRIHRQQIMHKNINPSNIVWNPETDQLKIIDFGISTILSREQPEIRNPEMLEGTLAYISPEQTGRMNRAMDYRTDLYSLGATFYHLLTGNVPFQARDAMELVHCHLAKMPVPPCDFPGSADVSPAPGNADVPSALDAGETPALPGSADAGETPALPGGVPKVLSNIIMKLMAKTAENRYQSAFGLKADLQKCLDQLKMTGAIETFDIGQHDMSERFQIPQKLYGRKQEIATLLAAFDRVSQSPKSEIRNPKSEMILVAGYAGIGKSSVVNEIHKPIVEKRGYFISGKFDQFTRNIPYSALIQAFRGLIRQLLTESKEQLVRWKETLLKALEPNGQVMIEVIPNVELIIDEQPAVSKLPPTQAQNRFNFVFQNFVQAFATSEHPLVIFLDDLQWADSPSLKLLELFMTDHRMNHVFIIGAYRDNEVFDAHPLMLTLNDIRQAGATVSTTTLKPLSLEHVNLLIADTLHFIHPYPLQADSGLKEKYPFAANPTGKPTHDLFQEGKLLAELCFRKTGGNPFFLTQFLHALYEDRLLEFDENNGVWTWDLENIRKQEMTDNVVELMADKMQKLPEETQHVLKLAACIGNQFDLHTLSIVHEKSRPETLADLWEVLHEELIIPLDDSYKYVMDKSPKSKVQSPKSKRDTRYSILDTGIEPPASSIQHPASSFKFLHDRVQQAAYLLIEEEHKHAVHLKIGRLMLEKTSEHDREERIFDIANHLNIGKNLITHQLGKDKLAELNLMAGKRAKTSGAYQAAFTYLQIGIDSVEGRNRGESWQRQYDLTLALYVEAAEAAYLSGNFEQMEYLTQVVLQQARTLLDKVSVYEVKIEACKAQNRLLEAVKTGLLILKLLGVLLPEKPNKFHIVSALLTTKFALAGKQIEDFINLPEMTDPYKLAIMRIVSSVGSATYYAVPDLLPLVVLRAVKLSSKHGNTSASAFLYAGYGLMLCGVLGDIDAGYRFGKLALNLLEHYNIREFRARTIFFVNAFIRHWKEHAKNTLKSLQEAYQIGLETGDLEYAAFSAQVYVCYSYFSGKELAEIERELVSYSEVMGQLKQETARNHYQIYCQIILNLTGNAAGSSSSTSLRTGLRIDSAGGTGAGSGQDQDSPPWRLVGDVYNEEHMLPLHLQANDRSVLVGLYADKLFLCYLFQAYPQAVKNADMAETYLDGVLGMLDVPRFHFYDSLARLAVFPDVSKTEQKRILRKVAANQKKMKKWAHYAPMNYQHKFYLVEAERARIRGKDAEAMDYYDNAIAFAKKHEYIHEEALANELAARFYLVKGKENIAQIYMREARYCYLKWGAAAKVQQLEQTHARLLTKETKNGHHVERRADLTLTDTTETRAGSLDLTTVIKASQAISGEIVLEKLLTRLMAIVIENAGAEYGVLLFEEDGEWIIKAEKETRPERFSKPFRSEFPTTIINYVARTKKPVVLGDAVREGQFTRDQYILAHHPRSVLCTPLLNQGKLIGILYLENNLTTGAFTSERLEILTLLSSQAAISIENATLYTTLELKVEARTAELMRAKELAEDAQQAAEVASQAKSTFLANISHELRTPLNAILGYAQLLKRDTGVMDRQPDAIETIRRSGEHVVTMIDELLDLSRIEARTIELNPTDVHLPGFLKHLVEMTRIQAQQKGIAFDSDIPSHLPIIVQADEQRLRQILLNLLNNAIKFTEEGSVTLRVTKVPKVPKVEHDTQQSSIVNLQFLIHDTGIGIPSEHLQVIFLPFHQVGEARTGREGIGLGLAISQQLARLMDGEVHVKSVVGQGTTFWFDIELPVIDERCSFDFPFESAQDRFQGEIRLEHHITGYKGNKRTVLLVDDNDENRALLRDTLSLLGFDVIEAVNGDEALHAAKQSLPDLILMDLFMPVMDGFEAIRRIRELDTGYSQLDTSEQRPAASDQQPVTSDQQPVTSDQYPVTSDQYPIIIGVSASVSSQIRQESLAAGCNDFLAKPLQIDDLLECLHRHLGIEWIYEDTARTISGKQQAVEGFPIPPQDMLLDLLELAKDGYINDIQEFIAQIKASDSRFTQFVTRIEQLADNFQYKQIIAYLRSYIKET